MSAPGRSQALMPERVERADERNATPDPLIAATCPRCGGAFRCGAHDAAPCACTTLALPPALLAGLRAQYTGCLCLSCLRELSAAAPAG